MIQRQLGYFNFVFQLKSRGLMLTFISTKGVCNRQVLLFNVHMYMYVLYEKETRTLVPPKIGLCISEFHRGKTADSFILHMHRGGHNNVQN